MIITFAIHNDCHNYQYMIMYDRLTYVLYSYSSFRLLDAEPKFENCHQNSNFPCMRYNNHQTDMFHHD